MQAFGLQRVGKGGKEGRRGRGGKERRKEQRTTSLKLTVSATW